MLLQFMPWCRLDKTYSAGEVVLIPFRYDEPIGGSDESANSQFRTILASYKDLDGRPVRHATLVQYESRPLMGDLSDEEIEITRECLQLACLSGLAKREYFNPLGPYCNTDCFILYAQRIGEPGFITIMSRRREGRTWNARPLGETVFTIPVHVSPDEQVSLDEPLLASLVAFRSTASDDDWARWQDAISCFNQANTDNDAIRYQVEWNLLCGAFERILGARSDYEDVAQKFADAFVPSTSRLVRDGRRRSNRWTDPDRPLRYEWMKEFYRVRGDFAHGRQQTRQSIVWKPLEHIVLAAIAFPVLVRCLLKKKGKYELTDDDMAQIDAFEALADAEFLKPPLDQKNSVDSGWSRLVMKARRDVAKRRAVEELKTKGLLDEGS